MPNWDYGEAYLRHPCGIHPIRFDNGSMVQVHDIMDGTPDFMKEADVIFCDPPWNKGNLCSFYTKADLAPEELDFDAFYNSLFGAVEDINPNVCFIEIGKQYMPDVVLWLRTLFPHVTFYNSTYYHKRENKCYIVQGSHKSQKFPLEDMDEEDAIAWICGNVEYKCIADPCMGRGLVGLHAYKNGRRFVGTELNHKRLSVLLENIKKLGGGYERMEG